MNNQRKIENKFKKSKKTKSSQTGITISRVVFGVADFDFRNPGIAGELDFRSDGGLTPPRGRGGSISPH